MANKEEAHKAFWDLTDNYLWSTRFWDISLAMVNPKTGAVDDDKTKNTELEYWIEGGKQYEHDIRLDCGAKTFEEAIVKFAKLVKKYYKPKHHE